MPPEHQALLILTCQKFPELEGLPCDFEAIVKGGSDRHFYRMQWPDSGHPPMVLMVYTLARRDNPKFVPATRRLAALGVRVPQLYRVDERRLCVWLQDLGKEDLHSRRDEPWSQLGPLYRSALNEAAKIHAVAEADLSRKDQAELEPAFDDGLYDWEQQYFLQHYVAGYRGEMLSDVEMAPVERCLKELRRQLCAQPRCLVHRDFQSQNILLVDGQAWFVDYQGLRLGLAEYDLASLLYDPYMNLTRSQREGLLHDYAAQRGLVFSSLRETFLLCSAQRLMQALGAYANLSRNLGKGHFLQHIPTAVERLLSVCEESQLLQPLTSLLK